MSKDAVRVATLHTGLKRDGPGLLLRDILSGKDAQILMARDVIAIVDPDIILLTRFDYDDGLVALTHFADVLSSAGPSYPYIFAHAPNSGVASGSDLDGDGWLGGAADAHGFGDFSGHGGMAILSKLPIERGEVQDLSDLLWQDFPDVSGSAFLGQRVSSVGHWDVPIRIPDWPLPLRLLAYHAGTPAFGGPARRNTLRNAAENRLWQAHLDGQLPSRPPAGPFVILGVSNLDPADGQGQRQVMQDLLADVRIQDPMPTSRGAIETARLQGGPNSFHRGDPALDTADFRDAGGPGNLRVDYVLPSADLTVLDAGVFWPATHDSNADILSGRDAAVSWHGLVWVDIAR